jgi:hypothetical protein
MFLRKRVFAAISAAIFAPALVLGSATDVWVTQTGAGSGNGSSLSNAAPVGFLSNSSNCGGGSGKVGPGTTIHLSGTFTFPGVQAHAAIPFDSMQCSGSAGRPIWLKTEPGFVCQSDAFAPGGGGTDGGCIRVTGSRYFTPSYITIGGATPCGTTTGGVNSSNTCDGAIQNTSNGTAGANHVVSEGMEVSGCQNCEIKNLAVINIYVRTPNWALTSVTCTGGACTAVGPNAVGNGAKIAIVGGTGNCSFPSATAWTVTSGGTIFSFTDGSLTCSQTGGTAVDESPPNDPWINAMHIGLGYGNTFPVNLSIHDCVFHDAGWVILPMSASLTFNNNQIYNFDHAIAGGPQNPPFSVSIHDNHFYGMNWSDGIAQNQFHQSAIMFQLDTSHNPQWYFTDSAVYNNTFDGTIINGASAWIFARASSQPTNTPYGYAFFNNVFNCSAPQAPLAGGSISLGDYSTAGSLAISPFVANNSIICHGGNNFSSGLGLNFAGLAHSVTQGLNTITSINNIVSGGQLTMYEGPYDQLDQSTWLFAPNGILTNFYENNYLDSGSEVGRWIFSATEPTPPWSWSNHTQILSQWQAALPSGSGGDAGAKVLPFAALHLDSQGHPLAGSPVAGAGTNLTSLCSGQLVPLCSDKEGKPRPTTGAWDVGAYEMVVRPPGNLTATPH